MAEKIYTVLQNFGHGHNHYIGEVTSTSSKAAFRAAIKKHFKPNQYDKYSEFFVVQAVKDYDDFLSYGYSYEGQRSFSCGPHGFRSNIKEIIRIILIEEILI